MNSVETILWWSWFTFTFGYIALIFPRFKLTLIFHPNGFRLSLSRGKYLCVRDDFHCKSPFVNIRLYQLEFYFFHTILMVFVTGKFARRDFLRRVDKGFGAYFFKHCINSPTVPPPN